jgi:DNA-binding MarR family transcriptional regulator
MHEEDWVTMKQAAEEVGVSPTQISRLAKRGLIRTEKDALNRRVTLVELNEVRQLFAQSKYYSQRRRQPEKD